MSRRRKGVALLGFITSPRKREKRKEMILLPNIGSKPSVLPLDHSSEENVRP